MSIEREVKNMFSYAVFDDLCKKNHKTPYQVSVDTGIATSTLSNWKMGNYTPKADKIKILADYFGVTIETFLKGVKTS